MNGPSVTSKANASSPSQRNALRVGTPVTRYAKHSGQSFLHLGHLERLGDHGSTSVFNRNPRDHVLRVTGQEHERNAAREKDRADRSVGLVGCTTTSVAKRLMELQVPFVVATGYPRDAIPAVLRGARYLAKPFFREELVEALTAAIESNARGGLGQR